MVTDKKTMDKIKEIVAKHYARLTLSVLGRDSLTPEQLQVLSNAGYDTSNPDSMLSLVYNHNFINHPVDENAPQSIEEAKKQQAIPNIKPVGEAHDYAIDSLSDKTRQYIDKLRLDVATRLQSIITENNDSYKMNALQNLNRPEDLDELVKESTIGKLKQKLRDSSGDANRDWTRIVITEVSNAIGIASVDRIVTNNRDSDLKDVYVYRIIVKDAKTCKYCRRFYQDPDGPKLYRLSTLLANGSNYGKKTDGWLPVIGATHPSERCSQIIELKPGFKLLHDGSVTYIGLDMWNEYLQNKLSE